MKPFSMIIFLLLIPLQLHSDDSKLKYDKLLFPRLIRERRFDEFENKIISMDKEITDIFERERIGNVFDAIVSGMNVYYADDAIPAWCEQSPDSYIAYTVKGVVYINLAWRYRGGGYADTVSEENFNEFYKHLRIAEEALRKAYELNPDFTLPASEMITICMGLGYPRAEMEKWFQRATSSSRSPDGYGAYLGKALYLQPKWHGTVDELLDYVFYSEELGTPPYPLILAYSSIWYFMDNRDPLLNNKTYLNKAALVYERYLEQYPDRPQAQKYCAFFAIKSGNYSLAAKYFPQITWNKNDPLWETQDEFDSDKELALNKVAELNNTD